MPTNIFNVEATARHHLYLTIILWLCGWEVLALWVFFTFFCFHWEEFKAEFLDFDEYLDELMDLLEIHLDDQLWKAEAWDDLITDYWKDKGQEKPDDLRIPQGVYDPIQDWNEGRFMNMWDHPDTWVLTDLAEWFQEDWELMTETDDIESTALLPFKELDFLCFYLGHFRQADLFEEDHNQFWVYTKETVWHPVYPLPKKGQSPYHLAAIPLPLTLKGETAEAKELRGWLSPKNKDHRFLKSKKL